MLNRIVELIKNTDEFNPTEKDESIATIMGYGDKWTKRNAIKVLGVMEKGKAYTVTEIQKGVGIESNQKTSALVRQLKDDKLVIRSCEKGKAYFRKA